MQACRVTEAGWTLPEDGAPPDEAPEYDTDSCVAGAAAPDGTWTFEMSSLEPVDDAAGIALVPLDDGPVTFQLTISSTAAPAPSA